MSEWWWLIDNWLRIDMIDGWMKIVDYDWLTDDWWMLDGWLMDYWRWLNMIDWWLMYDWNSWIWLMMMDDD